jgi:uncharacterized protein
MLTADLAQSWQRSGLVRPLRIPPDDADYLSDAAHLINLFGEYEGRPRRVLDEAIDEYLGTGTDYKIMRGFIKLLMDRCEFETASQKDPMEIRRALFLKAREYHPLLSDESRMGAATEAARELQCAPEIIFEGLYADLPENQILTGFRTLTATELIDLYNLAQAQAVLYRCVEMRLFVEPQTPEGYREIFGAIRAYRLIHTIEGNAAEGYEVRLDGPVSIFHHSQKYGVQMAVFLPALLLCKGWRMRAEIAPQKNRNGGSSDRGFFELTSEQTGLRSHYMSFTSFETSQVEKLMKSWSKLNSIWQLQSSRDVIDLGEAAFIPDFIVNHASGRKVYLELLGFWTPRYLEQRLKEFEHARFRDFLLIASDELRGSREPLSRNPPHTIIQKRSLDPAAIESALNNFLSEA